MTAAEAFYQQIGNSLKGAELSQMFGKPCLKVNGKAFGSFHEGDMVFKLSGKDHEKALGMNSAKLFDPSGKRRPMKEWVQVPYSHKTEWTALAKAAMKYVKS